MEQTRTAGTSTVPSVVAPTSSSDRTPAALLKKWGLVPLLVFSVLACLAAFTTGSSAALYGVVLAAAIVLGGAYVTWSMFGVLKRVSPHTALAVAFSVYWLKVSSMGAILLVPSLRERVSPVWFTTVMLSMMAWWMVAHIAATVKGRKAIGKDS